jgi:succinyl-CoA synthetase beta subunit
MKIHEYQAKEVFARHGIPVLRGEICKNPERARRIASGLGFPVVIKAQVHVGGRGKAGGIKIAKSADEAEKAAQEILGMQIKGVPVEIVMVAEAINIKKELYVGIVIDRSSKRVAVMTSPAGGVDIEEVARKTPEKICTEYVDLLAGLKSFQLRKLTAALFESKELQRRASVIIGKLYQAFVGTDCSLAEINPLVLTEAGSLLACDSKINIDDNALIRGDLARLRDPKAEDPLELQAKKAGLSYVGLDGSVACIVNGAGLAMTTMDIIKLHGGEPANFLDIGGSSSPDKVMTAMKIILTNKNVKSILINIFGGITRCDDVAMGLIQAVDSMDISHSIVVRLFGTNREKGVEILKKTDLHADVHIAETFIGGVEKAIELAEAQ